MNQWKQHRRHIPCRVRDARGASLTEGVRVCPGVVVAKSSAWYRAQLLSGGEGDFPANRVELLRKKKSRVRYEQLELFS